MHQPERHGYIDIVVQHLPRLGHHCAAITGAVQIESFDTQEDSSHGGVLSRFLVSLRLVEQFLMIATNERCSITIVTIVRMQFLVKFQNSNNFTYDNGAAAYWSVIELYVSIICVSLPSLAPLLKMMMPCVFGSTTIGGSKHQRSGYSGYGKNSSIKVQSEVTRTVGPYREDSITRSDDELQLVDMNPKFRMQTHVSSRQVV
jgi:hypothetical protein